MSNKNKKIGFFITSTGWGGLEMNTLKLARLLTEKGFEITLFTKNNSTLFEKGKEVFSTIELIERKRKYLDFKSAKRLSEILKTNDITRILVVDNKDLDVVAWTKMRYYKNLKIIYQQHMQIGVNKKDWLHTKRFKAIDVWVSPLPFLKQEIAIRTNFPLNRVQIIPIGLNTSEFKDRKYTKTEAKVLLGIHSKRLLVGIIGRISVKKGQFFLIQALQKMKSEGTEFDLLIFGSPTVNSDEDQKYAKEIQNYISLHNLQNNVHFVESNPNVAKFYNAIDVFALASQSETYGMVTIEAMLNSLPIIATDSGGTTEILGNGEYGTLYEYNNLDDFTIKLQMVLSSDDSIAQKARVASNYASDNFDVSKEVQGFIDVFNELQTQ